MIIVSGCPRSGTSPMMNCLYEVFGKERILGSKFPQDREFEKGEKETEANFACRKYIYENSKRNNRLDDYKDLNPNGFWECYFTTKGIQYSFGLKDTLKELLNESEEEMRICKIVSQGLLPSEPIFFNKMIYMIRHPRNVAKSQERLRRGFNVKNFNGETQNLFDEVTVHTPEMYISVTLQACRWFIENPTKEVIFIHFENLQKNPQKELIRIQEFLGQGDFTKAFDVIEPRLNRSFPEDWSNNLWEDAEYIYEKFNQGKYKEILEDFENPKRNFNRTMGRWRCARNNQVVNCYDCEKCWNNPIVRKNFCNRAKMTGIDWRNEPCLFECGFDIDRDEHVRIEESKENNHWDDSQQERQNISCITTNDFIDTNDASCFSPLIFSNMSEIGNFNKEDLENNNLGEG